MALGLHLGLGLSRRGGAANAAPTDIALSASTVAEDAALGAVVGALSATDPEMDAVTFSLTNDANGFFGISGSNLIVTGVLDFETAASHNVTVRATDESSNTYDEVFAITVTDVAETPPDNPPPDDGTIEDDGTFINPPIVTVVNGGIKLSGKKGGGSLGKFIYDLGAAILSRVYTIKYDPDFSLLTNAGKNAMVGFVIKQGNDFHLVGLRGDGSTGLDAVQVFGDDLWQAGSGFTEIDGGDALHGTQAGPSWIRMVVSADGETYTFRTSSNGTAWSDEFTVVDPTPHADVDGPAQFGIGAMFAANDTGSFSIHIQDYKDESAIPSFANVVLLIGANGVDGATTTVDESLSGHVLTFGGDAQLDTAQKPFGLSSILYDGIGDFVSAPDHANFLLPGKFTIEGFLRVSTGLASVSYNIISQWGAAGTRNFRLSWLKGASSKTISFVMSADGTALTHSFGSADIDSTVFFEETWLHFAADRDTADKMRVYLAGVMVASKVAASGSFDSAGTLRIGSDNQNLNPMNGWLKDIRITKGESVYGDVHGDSSFTPPSTAFPRS